MRGIKSSTIPISKEESVWRNKRPRKRTVSFAADRLSTWSTINSGSLGAMILSKTTPDLFTIVLRNDDIQEFGSKWDGILLSMTKIPHDNILEGLYKLRIRESEKLKTVLELYDPGDSSEEVRTWLSKDSKLWWREVSSKKFEIRILGAEMEILRRTPWSRIREQNSLFKEFSEIVGNGKPTGSVWKETIAVSASIWIGVGKVTPSNSSPIFSCSRVSENHRGPGVPEVRVRVVECRDGLARII